MPQAHRTLLQLIFYIFSFFSLAGMRTAVWTTVKTKEASLQCLHHNIRCAERCRHQARLMWSSPRCWNRALQSRSDIHRRECKTSGRLSHLACVERMRGVFMPTLLLILSCSEHRGSWLVSLQDCIPSMLTELLRGLLQHILLIMTSDEALQDSGGHMWHV